MLHDSHIPIVDSGVAGDAASATVLTDHETAPTLEESVELAVADAGDVWGEGAHNPFRDWKPDGEFGPEVSVDDDGVIEL